MIHILSHDNASAMHLANLMDLPRDKRRVISKVSDFSSICGGSLILTGYWQQQPEAQQIVNTATNRNMPVMEVRHVR